LKQKKCRELIEFPAFLFPGVFTEEADEHSGVKMNSAAAP
jgi:hypothetical protein